MTQLSKNLTQVAKRLEERKKELEKVLATNQSSESIEHDTSGKDIGDQAASSTMSDLKRSLHDTEFLEYSRIMQALEKIKDGSYGICVDCEDLILEKRLNFYPNAERCLSCQEAYEENPSQAGI